MHILKFAFVKKNVLAAKRRLWIKDQGPYSPTILKSILYLFLQDWQTGM